MNPADTTTDTRASSSSSSIYSSATSTPTTAAGPEPEQLQQQQQNHEPVASSKYEELMIQTKTKMADKFDQLEKDTGLKLEDETVSVVAQNSKSISSSQTNNGCSKINSNPKVSYGNGHDRLKETEYLFMEKEIKRFKEELNMKNDIINKMCKIRTQVERELEDLTASLFEEANKMVYDANVLRDRAEKELYEANLKIDMLTAEVQALKLLVITSTPSKPNAHLHPQLMMNTPKAKQRNHHGNNDNNSNNSGSSQTNNNINRTSLPIKSPSNYELGDKSSETSIDRSKHLDGDDDLDDYIYYSNNRQESHNNNSSNYSDLINCVGEIDPVFYEEFNEWRKCPTFEPMNSNFMKRIYDEEIYPVFNFKNKNLTSLVLRAIENNTLTVETVNNNSSSSSNNNVHNQQQKNNNKLPFPKKCALLEVARVCRYRMKIEDQPWYYICQLSRNRITTVCDLFCYLRYVQNGLVKSNVKDIYWQIMKRRRNIALSKLGFSPIT